MLKRDTGQKLYTSAFVAPVKWAPVGILPLHLVWKSIIVWLQTFDNMFSRSDPIPACDRNHSIAKFVLCIGTD